jgi:hypothetical protein
MADKPKDKKWVRIETPPIPSPTSSDDLGSSWEPEKAEVQDFVGFKSSADLARERKEAKEEFRYKHHVPRATRREVEDYIKHVARVRLSVIEKAPELKGIPPEELPIRDERWQKAARRLHKTGVVKVPDQLFHTPEDKERIDAKKEELLRIHNSGPADSEG